MKAKLLATALVLMGTAMGTYAQDKEDIRIYINPGHGSWTGNDRPRPVFGHPWPYSSTETDTTGFFESNTNLHKGLAMLDKLVEIGVPFDRTLNQTGERWEIGAALDLTQNIVMSRVKNGPFEANNTTSSDNYYQYNKKLYDIACEVEYNEFDIFVSIHSNAAGSDSEVHNRTNYHLYMYRGRNNKENVLAPGSWEMIEAAAKYSFPNAHAQWTSSSPYINGDIDFMSSSKTGSYNDLGYYGYLGVLKHGCPGYLVEGYFHTHSPSRHRAMNWDVDRIEGYQYGRGVAEYFEWDERDATGEIYGIVRDAHQSFNHTYWIADAGTDDVVKPLNGATIYLWKDGQVISQYTTDENYNGAFVFYGLEPGTYQVTCEHPEYFEAKPVDVVVEAGLTSYPKCYLIHQYYYGAPGEDLNYANVVPGGFPLKESYDLTADYVDRPIAQIAGMTPKRLIWMKDHLYVLAIDAENNAKVLVLDDKTGEVLADVDTDGIEGQIMKLSDITVTADGVLLAINKEKLQYADKYVDEGETRGTIHIYAWENDANGVPTGKPAEWLTSINPAAWYRAYCGDTFTYTGTKDNGKLVFSAITSAGTTTDIRNTVITVTDGVKSNEEAIRPSAFKQKEMGDDFRFMVSPADRNNFIVLDNGTTYGIREYGFEHPTSAKAYNETPAAVVNKNTTGAGFFKFSDDALMTYAAPGEASKELKLYTISRGLGSATPLEIKGATFDTEAAAVLTTGYPIATKDDAGSVVKGDFALIALRDNKISRFITDPEMTGVMSVSVDAEDAPAAYFDLNGRAVKASALTPGIYIRLQGSKATKVVVK